MHNKRRKVKFERQDAGVMVEPPTSDPARRVRDDIDAGRQRFFVINRMNRETENVLFGSTRLTRTAGRGRGGGAASGFLVTVLFYFFLWLCVKPLFAIQL